MATVFVNYPYPTGQQLDPDGHNANIMSDTSGEGIMSEPNGGLDTSNLQSGFQVQREHIQPGAVVRGFAGNHMRELHYTDDAAWDYVDDEDAFVPIPGTVLRFHIPYDAAMAVLQWSFFVVPARINNDRNAADDAATPVIFLKAFWDGAELPNTLTRVAESEFLESGTTTWTTAPVYKAIKRDLRNARFVEVSAIVRNVTAGFHSLDMRVFMDPVDYSALFRRTTAGVNYVSTYEIHNRLSISTAHARVVCFK